MKLIKIIVWAIFGNDEEYPPPLWYAARFKPSTRQAWINACWLIRNPIHNLTWHLIGVYGKEWERVGIDPLHSYARAGGWQWCVIKYKWWRLPYLSYINRRFRVNAGWSDAGNLTFISIRRTRPEVITW
jgi:hypothetical protein